MRFESRKYIYVKLRLLLGFMPGILLGTGEFTAIQRSPDLYFGREKSREGRGEKKLS